MHVDVLIGLQWGDEGKGKIVDYLAPKYDVIARFQGGPNAGHTLVVDGEKIVLHTIPSGILQEGLINVIGNGVVINPTTLVHEIDRIQSWGVDVKDRLYVDERAHLILPTHQLLDAASEAAKGKSKIGSTLRGIGPTYMDKTGRNGLRVGDIHTPNFKEKYNKLKEKHLKLLTLYDFDADLSGEEEWFRSIESIRGLQTINSVYFFDEQLKNGKKVLAEGAQGTMLDIDFGTYPFVTSSNTITASACKGLGIPPTKIKEVIGISKAYCTRVGSGPFPTELFDEYGELLRKEGNEFGATTGRPRRCGWVDLVALQYAVLVNGVTQIALTKADVLNAFTDIKLCVAYQHKHEEKSMLPFSLSEETCMPVYDSFPGWNKSLDQVCSFQDIPDQLREYVSYIERFLHVPVTMISTGPEREKLLSKTSGTYAQ